MPVDKLTPHFPLFPASGNYYFGLWVHEFDYFFDTSHKWKNAILIFVCLAYFTCITSSSFIHVITYCTISLSLNSTSFYVYTTFFFFIYSFADQNLGCFHILAAVKSASMNMVVQISQWDRDFNCFTCIHRSEIAGS